jgi:hypothetical protein
MPFLCENIELAFVAEAQLIHVHGPNGDRQTPVLLYSDE